MDHMKVRQFCITMPYNFCHAFLIILLFSAPVVLGSIVNSIEIVYHDHTFLPAKNNNYDYQTGIPISAGELFTGNDFVDTSKSKMALESE